MKLKIVDIEDSYLLEKMKEIVRVYRERGIDRYPYEELWTLMSGIAMEQKIDYDKVRHSMLFFRLHPLGAV